MGIVTAETLEMARRHNIILNVSENLDARRPDGEKSQILSKLTA